MSLSLHSIYFTAVGTTHFSDLDFLHTKHMVNSSNMMHFYRLNYPYDYTFLSPTIKGAVCGLGRKFKLRIAMFTILVRY